MGEILALLTGFFFSSSNLMARQGMKKLERNSGLLVTLLVNNAMNVIALVFLTVLALMPRFNLWGLFYFGLAGVFTSFAGRFFLFASIERIGASRAGLFKISAPMFTIFLGIIILGEQLTHLDLLGSAIVLAGLYLLSASGDFGKTIAPPVGIVSFAEAKEKPFALNTGVIYGILSGLALSIGHIFRKLGLFYISSPIVGVSIGSFVSLLCVTGYLLHKHGKLSSVTEVVSQTFCFDKTCRGFFWGGFLNTFAQYLFFSALLYTSVSIANILISTEALFNLLLVALFFRSDEPLTPRLVILSLIVMAGVALIML
ncbi:MAG: DMT family transporter [Bacillota bacterium]|nr:DMT family transporter [Bacillota bacterium]MDW7683600.1 DMT family transporter [Bacillota bacterium]